jgi:glucokinase
MKTLLVADIGGTKCELAIYELLDREDRLLFQKRYENAAYSGFEEITGAFLSECGAAPTLACIAVAGIVKGETVRLTNLPWTVDCRTLKERFGLDQVDLINDLTAVASSLSALREQDLLVVQQGAATGGPVRGIVAPGTGLGQGFAVETGNGLFVSGSEGGHTDFGPVGKDQLELLQWMSGRHATVSYETVISGPGLMRLYDFFREEKGFRESDWVREAMTGIVDRTPVIVAAAVKTESCPLCVKVIELFLSILGREAANLALKLYATGGLYLGGGILPRVRDAFGFSLFLESFRDKGPMSDLMKDIPVYLILRTDAALLGAKEFVCRKNGYRQR